MSDERRCITDDFSDVETKELLDSLPSFFSNFDSYDTRALLNWRFDKYTNTYRQFFNMGQAYMETSVGLIDNCVEDVYCKKQDAWIFPILFNAIHGIELYLKGVNSLLKSYLKLEAEWEMEHYNIEGNHDIEQLCKLTVSLIKKMEDTDSQKYVLTELEFVQKFISIIYSKTSDMTFARYPIDKKKNEHFYVDSDDNVVVSLRVLRQWILRLHRILDNMDYFDYLIDEMAANLSYYNNEWGGY